MNTNNKITLVSDNKLISKILGRSIENSDNTFSVFESINETSSQKIRLLILDLHTSKYSKSDKNELINQILKNSEIEYICSFNEKIESKEIDFHLEDNFSNLQDILEKIKTSNTKRQKKIELVKDKEEIAEKNEVIDSSEKSEEFSTHILLADDSKPVRNFVTKILTKKGYEVDTFEDGQKLIDYLTNGNSGDIILLDNQMPVKDGMDTLQELKGNQDWKEIPVLFLSALTNKDQVVNALELGADDYMEKPFNNNEFLARINVHVRIDHLKKNLLVEKEKSDKLLLNTLPKKIVEDLKMFGKTEPETFENVSVYFSDIVSFTNHSNGMKPDDLINELNIIFTKFDEIMESHQCERIKTIGDAYMSVCGMPEPDPLHAVKMARASVEILQYMKERFKERENGWELRIGIHSGSVVGGVVGEKKYIYDVFGDTINTSSRMESNSKPMFINVSETTYNLTKDEFKFIKRDALEVKGKGIMNMYFLDV